MPLSRCTRVLDATRLCDPSDVRSISTRVLSRSPDGSTRSHRAFTRELRRQVVLHEPDQEQRKADAISRRTAFGQLYEDGTGMLTVTGDGQRVSAAMDRVDQIARTLRGGGDERTLTALRSDVALDLLLTGWPVRSQVAAAVAEHSEHTGHTGHTGQAGQAGQAGHVGDPPAPGSTRCPACPSDAEVAAAHRRSRGSKKRLLRRSHGAKKSAPRRSHGASKPPPGQAAEPQAAGSGWGEPAGAWSLPVRTFPPAHVRHGFITAAHARQVALTAGSIWRRLVTDPLTGGALDLSTQRYRPTTAMSDLVAALDSMCRGPGCTVPAFRCDNDHQIAWPHGPTSIANLNAKHRRHHNHKTRGTWRSTMNTDGTVTWHTIAERTYINDRHNYDDPHNHPATDTERETGDTYDPPPF